MQLYFVRHGQSVNNATWDKVHSNIGRSPDPELTEVGYRQAECVAQFVDQPLDEALIIGRDPQNLAGFGITHVYCSLMVRAVETGIAITNRLKLPLYAWVDLHELGGIYLDDVQPGVRNGLPGHNRTYLSQRFPSLILPESVSDAGWWNRPFETIEEGVARAKRFLDDLHKRHGETHDRVVVVSHGDIYNLVLASLFNLPISRQRWFSLNNAGISRFILENGHTSITYLNRAEFLPRALIT